MAANMLLSSNLTPLSRRPEAKSSAVATKIIRRYDMGGVRNGGYTLYKTLSLRNSFVAPLHSRRHYETTLSDSSNNDDQDFVDGLSGWSCIGSSHGWLGYINPKNLSFCLFKPTLLNHSSYLPFISLPPLQFLCDNPPNVISKMIFSSSPSPIDRHSCEDDTTKNLSVLVVITLDWADQLGPAAAFCRISDPNWTTLANFPLGSCSYTFQDIAYYSKHKLFYVVTDSGAIYSWDLSSYNYCSMKQHHYCNFQHLIKPPSTKFPIRKLEDQETEIVNCKYYLVMDESSGYLLMIRLQIYYQGYTDLDGYERKSYTLDVHRLDFDTLEWVVVKGLVDTALFIGRNNGVVVDVRKVPGMMIPGYVYLACNADNFFQLTGICMSNSGFLDVERCYAILHSDMTKQDGIGMTSFPVWNFG
ncbi:hypothetical protein Leryth_008213 [Lithospermum erythrorhizon]|nr:hypothetical protein Leryth_008213 [Lithospermum erythrorhizon]